MNYVSQREFAKHINRSHVWVNRLVKGGRIPSNAKGQIPLEAGLEAYAHSQQVGDDTRREWAENFYRSGDKSKQAATKKTATKPAPKPAAKPEPPAVQEPEPDMPTGGISVARVNEQFNRARLAEKTYQAKLKELEFKEASGQLIPAADVEADAAKTGAEVRERLLSVPPRVAGLYEGKTAREIERIIDEAINDALSTLQRERFKGG